MKSHEINKHFLSLIDAKTNDEILTAIANHYGITKNEALDEITGDEAEPLLDYLTGATRTAISLLMGKKALSSVLVLIEKDLAA